MSVVKEYLQRAVYDLRFEQKQLVDQIIRYDLEIRETQTRVERARERLNEIAEEKAEIYSTAAALDMALEVRED